MIHIIYCFVIGVLVVALVYQSRQTEYFQKELRQSLESIRQLKSRLHDVINEYRRDRDVPTISWTEFVRSEDVLLIPALPNGTPPRISPHPVRKLRLEPKRPSHSTTSTSNTSSFSSSNRTAASKALEDDTPSSSYSSDYSSSSSSSSCDSGSSSSSSSCD